MFESDFFSKNNPEYREWIDAAVQELESSYPEGPYPGDGPEELTELLRGEILPQGAD